MKRLMNRRTSRIPPPEPSSGGKESPPLWAIASGMGGFYSILIVDSLLAEPGSAGYGANQSGLIACAVGVALLIPLRIRIWRVRRKACHPSPPHEYWRDGSGPMDLLFLMTALVLFLLVDWKLLPQHGVRIGVVGAIAIGASIVAWLARRARGRKNRADGTGEDKE